MTTPSLRRFAAPLHALLRSTYDDPALAQGVRDNTYSSPLLLPTDLGPVSSTAQHRCERRTSGSRALSLLSKKSSPSRAFGQLSQAFPGSPVTG